MKRTESIWLNNCYTPRPFNLKNLAGPIYLGGKITGIQKPVHYDFRGRRNTPNELRSYFQKLGWNQIVKHAILCIEPTKS